MRFRFSTTLLLAGIFLAAGSAQTGSTPIPDVPMLLQQVLDHQRQLDATRENYTYRELQIIQELNKDGSTKKITNEEYDVFFVNTHQIERLVKKNGKELSA